MLSPSYKHEQYSVDVDEEPPHQALRCLQIQLFSFLVFKELRPPLGLPKTGPINGVVLLLNTVELKRLEHL